MVIQNFEKNQRIHRKLSKIEEELEKAHWEDFSYTASIIKEIVKQIKKEVEG